MKKLKKFLVMSCDDKDASWYADSVTSAEAAVAEAVVSTGMFGPFEVYEYVGNYDSDIAAHKVKTE